MGIELQHRREPLGTALPRSLGTALMTALVLVAMMSPARASESIEHVEWSQRSRGLSLTIYRPAQPDPKGTVVMASGDVGWVGLAVTMSQRLAADGYIVVGINTRQYLSTFTTGAVHLSPNDIQRDYGDLSRYLRSRGLLKAQTIVSGVSEGAALAVLAAAAPDNHSWITGVVTMGLPASAEIAWRWSDFTTWI